MMDGGRPSMAAIILAAGQSRRMGAVNKLLLDVNGVPMIRGVVETLMRDEIEPVVVVTGHEYEQVEACLEGIPVQFAFNPRYEEGMGASIAVGIRSLAAGRHSGVLVCVGDLPNLNSSVVAKLVNAFQAERGQRIVAPVFKGKRGHPVLFPIGYSEKLKQLRGDVGARDLLRQDAQLVVELETEDDGVTRDWDA
ncbi:MAG: hypothetical protein CBD18_00290 [Opitutales bacterium TMED158]|nr:MAG: hypothetical protein CBD18_00290 [Opitutales bacterium TMED158]